MNTRQGVRGQSIWWSVVLCGAALLAHVWSSQVRAATVDGLYEGTVRVADTGEASRQKAFVDAMSVVLVKLSGRRDAPVQAAAALKEASRYVQRYGYVTGGRIEVGFDNAAINAVLDRTNLPLWGRERPSVLLVFPNALLGMREAQSTAELSAKLRGIPVVWATELSDSFQATAIPQIQALGQRYGAEAVALARGTSAASLNWQVVFNGMSQESLGSTEEGPQLAADVIAAYYAVNSRQSEKLVLEVSGIDNIDAYGATLNYLSRQLIVRNVAVDALDRDVVRLTIELRGTQQALQRALLVDKTLLPVSEGANGGVLQYRYNRAAPN